MFRASRKSVLGGVFAIAVGLVVSLGCGGSDSNPASSARDDNTSDPPPDSNTTLVTIQNSSFSPTSLTVKVGTQVTWRNNDGIRHTVTSDSGGELDSPLLSTGNSYSHTFSTAGTFPYHCTPHPFMTGTVVVEP